MATAYRVIAPLVLAKDKEGRIHHHYREESAVGDSVIPWLSDEQAAHFLSEGLVEKIETADESESEAQMAVDRVTECLEALGTCDLPIDSGAPAARDALRERGHKFGNDTIAAAIKARKATLSGTVVVDSAASGV